MAKKNDDRKDALNKVSGRVDDVKTSLEGLLEGDSEPQDVLHEAVETLDSVEDDLDKIADD